MSSHHFVKEGQEPAILICEPEFNQEFLSQLLEWCPKVIVLQNALESVIQIGIKVDVVICEEGVKAHLAEQLHYQQPVEIIETSGFKEGILMFAINHLEEKKYTAVHLIGDIDRQIMLKLPALTSLDLVSWTGQVKWIYCRSDLFKKWVPTQHRFLFLKDDLLEIEADIDVIIQYEAIYTTITTEVDGVVKISGKNGGFWLGEYI